MFVKINDIDVNATLISTFYKSEGEPYQITYYMLSGPTLVEEFSSASDMNDKYELVSKLSIGSGGGSVSNNIAPIYDNTTTYTLGSLIVYNGLLYKCTTAVTVAEEFDSTKWTRTTIAEIIGNINTVLSVLTTPSGGGN